MVDLSARPAAAFRPPALPAFLSRHRMAIAVSLLVHLVLLWAILQARPAGTLDDIRPMDVFLLPAPRAEPLAKSEPVRPAPPLRRQPASAPPASPAEAPRAPDVPPQAAPAAAASGANPRPDLDAGVARAWRRKMGCQNADILGLTPAEQDACLDALGAGSKTAPLYPVISQKKKDIFDGVHNCPKGDDWCLYRSGKGPYPGLLGLGRDFRSK